MPKEIGLITVLRVFVLDSLALDNIEKLRAACNPDLIELVPGLMPKIIRQVHSLHRTPLIAGGLIRDKEDTMSALSAGAISISTSCEEAWAGARRRCAGKCEAIFKRKGCERVKYIMALDQGTTSSAA